MAAEDYHSDFYDPPDYNNEDNSHLTHHPTCPHYSTIFSEKCICSEILKKGLTMPIEDTKCPECGLKMVSRNGKYGTFWGCSDYPACKGTRDSMGRSKAEREMLRSLRIENLKKIMIDIDLENND